MSTFNRRAILAGAASASAAVAVVQPLAVRIANARPVALSVGGASALPPLATDRRLFDLEPQVAAAEAAAIQAGSIFSEAEHAMFAWQRHNPKPQVREFTIGKINYDGKEVVYGTESYERYKKAVDEANADLSGAVKEHIEALNLWSGRRQIACGNCRYEEHKAEFERLIDRADALREDAAAIATSTVDGLRCKARMLSDADLGCINGVLAESIINGLRALPAVRHAANAIAVQS